MITLGIVLTLAFALTVALGLVSEARGATDALYSNPQALAQANARVYVQARAFIRKGEDKVKRGVPIAKVFNRAFMQALDTVHTFNTIGTTSRASRLFTQVSIAGPRLETIARAKSTARAIGIRLRPVCQALRKAYMREVNRLGIDFETAREIDRMLV